MTNSNSIRIFLWTLLGIALWFNYQAWYKDYELQPASAASERARSGNAPGGFALPQPVPGGAQAPVGTAPPAVGSSTGASQSVASAGSASLATAPTAGPAAAAAGSCASGATDPNAYAPTVHVRTDVLDAEISLRCGALVQVNLTKYPRVKGQPERVELESHASPETLFVVESGLTGLDSTARPGQLSAFQSPTHDYDLGGRDQLVVPLTATDDHGVTVTKQYTFRRGQYRIGLTQSVQNHSEHPLEVLPYVRIVRNDPPTKRSMFNVETYSFHGPAIYDGAKYRTLKLGDAANRNLELNVRDGWIAAPQHHFVTAVIPPVGASYSYSLQVQGDEYALGAAGATHAIPPGGMQSFDWTLYSGPKLQSQLAATSSTLPLVEDYGRLTLLSKPLFQVLQFVHSITNNWGVAIIVVTFLLKLLFYPLSEASGRSMAKMKALAPRIKNIQETYKDDREKSGRAMMELYQREKVNPLTGCLPTLIQIPVFLAFYWVLVESVEMRQAPFFGWINDLSSRDPYFILPAIMAAAMFVQYKLNPAPPDPMQARVMMIMPLAMSITFAFFPAGLVLYWVTNTTLSILQQWNINRRIEAAKKT